MTHAKPAFKVPDGSLEAMKWLALVLMTGDHINTYLLKGAMPMLYATGRIAFPLFAFVLAYNLARPGANLAYKRTSLRLTLFGAIAAVVFVAPGLLGAHWLPLNIMFTFLASIAIIALIASDDRRRRLAGLVVFLGCGAVVDYYWTGIAIVVSMFWFLRTGQPWALMTWLVLHALALPLQGLLLYHAPLQYGIWSLAAVPLVMTFARYSFHVPRTRWLFYVYYPAHLLAIWAIAAIS